MEIGLDYMHMRSRAQHALLRWAGIVVLLIGIGLVLSGGAYYGYIYLLRSDLERFTVQRDGLQNIPATAATAEAGSGGVTITPLALSDPAYLEQGDELGFVPVRSDWAAAPGTQPPITRVSVSDLGIDRKLDADSVIGISSTDYASGVDLTAAAAISVNPGERGASWVFGESSQAIDGFGGLTDAPGLLSDGEEVFIVVSNGSREYLYLGTHTDVIHKTKLQLSSGNRATVHLVTPVPPGLNDHFLVLSGELVGMR